MRVEHKGTLVFAEQDGKRIHPVTYELIAKARYLTQPVYAALLGPPGLGVDEIACRGCDSVYYLAHQCFSEPNEVLYKENLVPLIKELKPAVVLIGATTFGRSLAPRVAAALNTGLTADCTGLEMDPEGYLVQIRPAFTENILAHIKTVTMPQMATIRYGEFPAADRDLTHSGKVVRREPLVSAYPKVQVLGPAGAQKENITEAEVIVAGGRGVKNPEDFKLLRKLAHCLGGTIGASRDVVDAGFVPKEYQVGYSGHRVKPRFYIACGISGAPQHLAGMKEAETIIAINTDRSAPIFKVADYGIVGDLYEIVPRLLACLAKKGGTQNE